ncbi:ABC transporter permease [Segnochrobactrum spirostomi]|uniref:ABC transporter permease n=1 Tax=Segnochrobactrum spirostomi TaxID=2608987 RepID=A0A6A7Y807_9HYPH|nr:ABC transporter permease [Segnochrobactrum spirostomi]MQT15490.1 ABC transporter permease [Segnochrobactrum spirostomi]
MSGNPAPLIDPAAAGLSPDTPSSLDKEGAATAPPSAIATVLHDPGAVIGLVIIAFYALVALFAPLIEPYSTVEATCGVFQPPSAAHWLGCDDGGIDMLSLVIRGSRISMLVGLSASLIAIGIGTVVGVAAGYFGGWVDMVLMRITDYLIVIPQMVLMIVVAAVWGPSLTHVVIVIGVLMWTSPARLIRAQVKGLRGRVFVRRAEALGASHVSIIRRHILPQLGPLLAANAVLAVTLAIFNETALAFLGLSDSTAITWGTILEHAFNRAAASAGAWWAVVPAGLAVGGIVMGCYMLGRAIEDSLNPRLRISYLSLRHWQMRTPPHRPEAAPRRGREA